MKQIAYSTNALSVCYFHSNQIAPELFKIYLHAVAYFCPFLSAMQMQYVFDATIYNKRVNRVLIDRKKGIGAVEHRL